MNSQENRLSHASVLMAGDADTKNFTSRMTIGHLMLAISEREEDSIAIQEIVATDFEEYREVN